MLSPIRARGGGWNFRAAVCIAAMALSLPASGKLFGAKPGYVQADSGRFAASLLDHNRGEWSQEAQARFVVSTPDFVEESPTSAPQQQTQTPATTGGNTVCIAAYTKCPIVPTKCQTTKCPEIQTKCSATASKCDAQHTVCPEQPTTCPIVDTECPTHETVCVITKCPETKTICPVVPTTCELTKCPKQKTVCPVDPTNCEFTVCPKTTVCGGAVKTICYGVGLPEVCVDPNDPNFELGMADDPARATAVLARADTSPPRAPIAVTFVPRPN